MSVIKVVAMSASDECSLFKAMKLTTCNSMRSIAKIIQK